MSRRGASLVGSVIAHAVIAAVIVVAAPERAARVRQREAVELLEVEVATPRSETRAIERTAEGGGGEQARMSPTRRVRATAKPKPIAETETDTETGIETDTDTDTDADTGIDTANPGGGNGTGPGTGTGHGNGRGTAAAPAETPRMAFERLVAAPRSQARPARLVYPKRERQETPATLCIAMLTIDTEGVVVGATIKHAPSAHLADRALSAVFRFAYDPALDAAGHPIRSTVEQHFVVE